MISNICRADGCENILEYAPQPENKYTQFCETCKRCPECRSYLSSAEIDYCEKWHLLPYKCSACMTIEFKNEIENKKFDISVTQQELDLINVARLNGIESHVLNSLTNMVIPNVDVDMSTNQYVSAVHCQDYWQTLTLDQKLLVVAKVEAITAAYAVLLKREKQETLKTIKISMDDAAKKRFHEATSAPAQGKQALIKCPVCEQKFLPESIITHRANCKPDDTETKKKKTFLTQREKAIEASMKYGISREVAELAIDAQFLKRGIDVEGMLK